MSPKISDFLVEELKAAQAAMLAAGEARDPQVESEEIQVEIQDLKVAEAATGKTAYDEYLIDSWLAVAYVKVRDYPAAVPYLQAAGSSQYASPSQRKGMLEAALGIQRQLSHSAGTP